MLIDRSKLRFLTLDWINDTILLFFFSFYFSFSFVFSYFFFFYVIVLLNIPKKIRFLGNINLAFRKSILKVTEKPNTHDQAFIRSFEHARPCAEAFTRYVEKGSRIPAHFHDPLLFSIYHYYILAYQGTPAILAFLSSLHTYDSPYDLESKSWYW